MKFSKPSKFLALLIVAALPGLAGRAHATLALTSYAPQPVSGSAFPLGVWVTNCIHHYNNSTASNLPLPPGSTYAYAFKATNTAPAGYPNVNGQTSISIPTGTYDYVALYWGSTQTNNPYQLYYIGTPADVLAGSVTFTSSQNGLSWYAVWGPAPNTNLGSVPEPSTVLAGALLLLPFGLGTVRVLRKNKSQ